MVHSVAVPDVSDEPKEEHHVCSHNQSPDPFSLHDSTKLAESQGDTFKKKPYVDGAKTLILAFFTVRFFYPAALNPRPSTVDFRAL